MKVGVHLKEGRRKSGNWMIETRAKSKVNEGLREVIDRLVE